MAVEQINLFTFAWVLLYNVLGVLRRFYFESHLKDYDVFFCQVDFLVVLYYGEGRYFKILSCFFHVMFTLTWLLTKDFQRVLG